MPLIGAELEGLDNLAAQLDQAGTTIGTTRANATQTGATVVQQVQDASAQASARILGEMAALRDGVMNARNAAESTQWTGSNAEVFRGAHAEFTTAMQQAEATTNQIFSDFQQAINQMSQSLQENVSQLETAMAQAEESSRSMGQAVRGQRENLDQAMNTGWTVS
ncbi:hypothetical protein [Actinophytocola sp.]|uniref:hypothetical protein n=1 Tax=Actinophytocola sp. TaxID=1872138 RepID=UPI002ED62BA4